MKKILVVDDERDITATVKSGLAASGFTVDVYNDPEQALTDFVPGKYDLAIIDFKMPKMNGFDLYRGIKMRDDKVKVFFMSAFEMYHEEFKKMFPESEVNRIIRKPVGIDELVMQINSELKSF
ncbi:MAG TPA: response regulator [Candidatus Nitrosotalea sp.]|nr:response regulator [Candidatus Nitrosotalea sp.]